MERSDRDRRASAVAKLKRAASLPRMKDGRRPPLRPNPEAASDPENNPDYSSLSPSPDPPHTRPHPSQDNVLPLEHSIPDDHQPDSNSVVPESLQSPSASFHENVSPPSLETHLPQPGQEGEGEGEDHDEQEEGEADAETDFISTTPEPGSGGGGLPKKKKRTRSKSRSRSRNRNSKDIMRRKSPAAPSPLPDDSSQDEGPTQHQHQQQPIVVPVLTPLYQPSPYHFSDLTQAHLLRAPTPGSPTPLPTLEQLATQRGIFRSNSSGHKQIGRNIALHKLTNGMDSFEEEQPPTPPPTQKLARNNTVAGGERLAARTNLFNLLNSRAKTPVKDLEEVPEQLPPSPLPFAPLSPLPLSPMIASHSPIPPSPVASPAPNGRRRRRRKSKGEAKEFQSDSEYISSRSNTPMVPLTSIPPNAPTLPLVPSEEPTPPPLQEIDHGLSPSVSTDSRQEVPTRRRGVLVEDDYDSPPSPPPPNAPSRQGIRQPLHNGSSPLPISPDPSTTSMDADDPHGPVGVPVFMSQHSSMKPDGFPRSPFGAPYHEHPQNEADDYDDHFLSQHHPDQDREISWAASLVPEIGTHGPRMPINEHDDDDEEEVDLQFRDIPRDSQYEHYDSSVRDSGLSAKSVKIIDTTGDVRFTSPSPSSAMALSNDPSRRPESEGSGSPKIYPMPMSVASPRRSEDMSLVGGEERQQSPPPSTWSKVKHSLTRSASSLGRRSRAESISREKTIDYTDSAVNRESGASLTSSNKADNNATQYNAHGSPPVSGAASGSPPLSQQHQPYSPIPTPSLSDMSKYQDSKLFPFPGIRSLEEQRNRSNGNLASAAGFYSTDESKHRSTSSLSGGVDGPRERKLSHQVSDSRLLDKLIPNHPPPTSTPPPPHVAQELTDVTGSKLPMTLPGVKKWLKNKKSSVSHSTTPPPLSPKTISGPILNGNTPSLSNLLGPAPETLDTPRWQDNSITSATHDHGPPSSFRSPFPVSEQSISLVSTDTSVTQKPDTKHHRPTPSMDADTSYLSFDNAFEGPRDGISTSSPEPHSSAWSDYPIRSSDSSSLGSPRTTQPFVAREQGQAILERLDESLGSRSPMWATAIDEPPRKLLLSSPVLQVVNANTVKDRFLFLFSDILVIAKPVMQDEENIMDIYSKRGTLDKKFVVKNVVLLSQLRFFDGRLEQPKPSHGSWTPNPALKSFMLDFDQDPDLAITSLCSTAGLPEDPSVIAQLLFKCTELDRAKVGLYLTRRSSRGVLKAYLDSFGFIGMRIDKALRAFLLSISLPPSRNLDRYMHSSLEYVLDIFASRWYEANAGAVPYDRDLAVRLVRGVVQLNELLHGEIASEPGPTNFAARNVTLRDFVDAFRRYDSRCLVSDDSLEKIYESIRFERLSQAPTNPEVITSTIAVKKQLPSRLTYKVQSDPVILRIPHADPELIIHLHGQDLVFEPKVLSFAKSSEASFRVMGTSLGAKTVLMSRSGPNALRYTGLPFSSPVTVERAFMRNTFQLAFKDPSGNKKRYMFSVDDPIQRHQWAVSLRGHISMRSSPTGKSEFYRAVEKLAFDALQRTLLGTGSTTTTAKSTPSNESLRPARSQETGLSHVRSKSRSQVYHSHGAGQNELDLISNHSPPDHPGSYDSSFVRTTGEPIWTGQQLHLQCQQSSSVPLVLSYLQVGTPDAEVTKGTSV